LSKKYDYDMIILGGGSGGFVSSKLAAGLGKKVALIEKNKLGGECTNSGCIPSKAFIKAARAFNEIRNLKNYGINIPENMKINQKNAIGYPQNIIKKVAKEHKADVLEKSGIVVYFGNPVFSDNHTIKIKGRTLSADKFIITTGSSPFIPPIEGINKIKYLTNEDFFNQKNLPKSMIVLGGGAIGIELAQSLNRLGVETTVVEMLDRILYKEDKGLAVILDENLRKEGLKILTKTKAVKLSEKNKKIILTVTDKNNNETILTADTILVAVGRKANIEGMDIENAQVKVNKKGIIVDKTLRTTAKNIYACGDVVGPYQFSHMAEYQAVIAVMNAFLPFKKKVSYNNVLWVTFTDPELAHLGLTEDEARNKYGKNIRVYKWGYNNIDRAVTDNTENGLGKIICKKNGEILGAHYLGQNAGDIIHEAQILKSLRHKLSDIQSVIHAYPTYADITRQMGKKAYIDKIMDNIFIKIIGKFRRKK